MGTKWHSGIVHWRDSDTAYISVVFSWHLDRVPALVRWYEKYHGLKVLVGGPAAGGRDLPDVVRRHNPNATFTSRGCVRSCPFCVVPKIEGKLRELDDWPVRSIVCDNNLLACSTAHFDRVVDKLKPLKEIDFNQGLDARLLTDHHAERLRELDVKFVRLAWDHTKTEKKFMAAYDRLRAVGFPKRSIRVYVLIGFDDTPEDALYRLETIWKGLKIMPNPMRYQPLDTPKRNAYVSDEWTDRELKRYMRYWSRLRWTGSIPFEEFRHSG